MGSSARLAFLLALSLGLIPKLSFSYPEMVRHGYANCIACHVGPNGGGLLTPYGRQLSQEVLSKWATPDESAFAYGGMKFPDWLNIGGDLRGVQTFLNNPKVQQGQFILMQADVEAAVQIERWQIVGALGRQEPTTLNPAGGALMSRRHYVNYRPTDQLSFRAGRFQTAFGINTPDHILVTKRGLRWDEGSETYNIEGAWLGEEIDTFVTASFGRPDAPKLGLDTGVAVRSGVLLGERFKTGISYFYGSNDSGKRHLIGPYGILGITPRFFVLVEIDFQNLLLASTESRWGAVDYLRFDYEVFRGGHLFLTQELARLDFNNPGNRTEAYGAGFQFFPRPHFELIASFQKSRVLSVSTEFSDYGWFLVHYYL